MFYFDKTISNCEKNFLWDQSLIYLEKKFLEDPNTLLINSLVGFSWYYLIEGPIDSKRYRNDESKLPFDTWKKYIDIGNQMAYNNQYFNFIVGYTLSMHGFLINKEYEIMGIQCIKKCCSIADDQCLLMVATNFLKNSISLKSGFITIPFIPPVFY